MTSEELLARRGEIEQRAREITEELEKPEANLDALEEEECLLEIEEEVPQVFVACLNKSLSLQAFKMTRMFREAGIRAEMDHQGRSLKAQFKYADKLGAKYIAILADDELARGVLKLRNMATKEEWEVPLDSAPEALKERL